MNLLASIKKLLAPPVFDDEDKTQVAYYLNLITLIASGLLVIFLVIINLDSTEFSFNAINIILFAIVGLLLVARVLMKTGRVKLAGYAIVGLTWAGLAYLAWNADGIRDTTFIALFVVILMASLLLGTRAMLSFTAASIFVGFGLVYLETSGVIQPTLDTPENFGRDITLVFVLFGTFLYLVTNSLRNALTRARSAVTELQASNQELQVLQINLEQRVTERTTELEAANQQSQHRAAQFEAMAQVAREISSSQDLETLLPKITNVISQQFGFYHVGVFLLDLSKEFAVLRAANSPGGQKMLARDHRLKVGEIGIVGFVTNRGKARIALDTGTDAVYFDNPDLPNTRSEMALPMIVGGEIIGALDVQSVEPNAFSQDDIETLSTLADQVATAIQNARLYEENLNALQQAQVLSQQITSLGWNQYTRTKKLAGVHRKKSKSVLLREPLKVDDPKANDLNLPIILRGQNIGEIKIQAADERTWTQDELDIASAIIDRAAIAMENARLLNEAQQRATREQVIGEIASSVSSSTDMENILRNAVQELGRKMGGAEVVLELGTEPNETLGNDNA